jgi:protein involved in polysaccharide export with SLBB domain
MAVYEKPEMVTISGAVNYPGKYVLAKESESLRHCKKERFDFSGY